MSGDRRKLSNEDIQAFIDALNENESHCRFKGINPQELSEAVLFFRELNIAINESKKTVRNTLIKLLLSGIVLLILLGAGIKMNWKLPLP